MAKKINVVIQQTAGHFALKIPTERLEAIAHEVTRTGIKEWGVDDTTPRIIVLADKWGDIDTNIIVPDCRRRSSVSYLGSGERRNSVEATTSKGDGFATLLVVVNVGCGEGCVRRKAHED